MEIVLAAVVAAAVAGIVVIAGQRRGPAAAAAGPPQPTARAARRESEAPIVQATATARPAPLTTPPAGVAADPQQAVYAAGMEAELQARRAEIARIEERLLGKEESLEVRLSDFERKERALEDRSRNLEVQAEKLKQAKHDQTRELERLSGLSASQARQILLRELED
jgi:ribonuclease Y